MRLATFTPLDFFTDWVFFNVFASKSNNQTGRFDFCFQYFRQPILKGQDGNIWSNEQFLNSLFYCCVDYDTVQSNSKRNKHI